MKERLLAAIGLSATFFLIGCADDQARSQIAVTNAQVAELQQSVSVMGTKTSTQKLVDILNKLEDLQNQINELNGNVDTLKNDQQSYKSTQEQLNQSLEQQIQAIQKGSTGGGSSATPVIRPIMASSTANSNKSSLTPALKKIKARQFPGAIKDLKNIISTSANPDTVLTNQ